MLADANGGDLPNKVLYGFPPSYPVRPHGHLQNYGKYILENNNPYDTNNINFENNEDPLAGLIVSRNLDPSMIHPRYTEFNPNSSGGGLGAGMTLPLMPGGQLDRLASSSYNSSPNTTVGGRGALIHQP